MVGNRAVRSLNNRNNSNNYLGCSQKQSHKTHHLICKAFQNRPTSAPTSSQQKALKSFWAFSLLSGDSCCSPAAKDCRRLHCEKRLCTVTACKRGHRRATLSKKKQCTCYSCVVCPLLNPFIFGSCCASDLLQRISRAPMGWTATWDVFEQPLASFCAGSKWLIGVGLLVCWCVASLLAVSQRHAPFILDQLWLLIRDSLLLCCFIVWLCGWFVVLLLCCVIVSLVDWMVYLVVCCLYVVCFWCWFFRQR